MTNDIYFLIHGAWHDNTCWETFVPVLKETKHCQVSTPNRPRSMNLDQYVTFLKQQILEQERPVILVGHSLAGVIVSQLAEEIPEYVKQIIYITAYVPQNNHSMLDEVKASNIAGQLDKDIIINKKTISLNKTENVKHILYTNCENSLAQHYLDNLTADTLSIFAAPVILTESRFGILPKKYIACLQDKALHPSDQKRMYTRLTHCTVANINADHTPFLSMPNELAKLF